MPETYRKFGRTVRYENGVVVRAEEAGEAIEDGEAFSCRPIARRSIEPIDESELDRAVESIRSIVERPVMIERMVVSEGFAEHELGVAAAAVARGRAKPHWSERTRRVHLSMACRSERAMIYLGDFDLHDVEIAAGALARCGSERDPPARIRLAPIVSAALLPGLIGVAPPNVRIRQTAGGFDGKGEPVADREVTKPYWYRPSYRSRPVRAPFNVRAECDVEVMDDDLPRAVALLAPPDRLILRVLCVDGDDVFPATVRVARIDAVARGRRWYPYGAGSFGSEMML